MGCVSFCNIYVTQQDTPYLMIIKYRINHQILCNNWNNIQECIKEKLQNINMQQIHKLPPNKKVYFILL